MAEWSKALGSFRKVYLYSLFIVTDSDSSTISVCTVVPEIPSWESRGNKKIK